MDYTVDITMQTKRPLTEDDLFDIAEMGGVAVGQPGGKRIETTLTVSAPDVRKAAMIAIAKVLKCVEGRVVALESMTTEEADRRLEEQPQIAGVAEIAAMLGVSKQRVSTLSKRNDFPSPMATLASGPVWRLGDLSTFAMGWRRKAGRPRSLLRGAEIASAR